MATVYVEVDYLDAAERTATIEYRLKREYDETTPNIVAVLTDVTDLIGYLAAMSWAEITNYRVKLAFNYADTGANIAANNQIRAFIRAKTTAGVKSSFEVSAWDDDVYDQNSQNMLSSAFLIVAQDAADLLENWETGLDMGDVDYAQSRTRKTRGVRPVE